MMTIDYLLLNPKQIIAVGPSKPDEQDGLIFMPISKISML